MRVCAALLALLVIAGCGVDPRPKEPRSSASASAKPTSAAVPTMPAQAKKNSPEGAAAFVKHYIDVFNYASNTGDVTELSRLSSPKCDGCQSYIKLYRDTYAAGGYIRGGFWHLGTLALKYGEPENYVTTTVKIDGGTSKRSAHDGSETDPEGSERISFAVANDDRAWGVTQLGLGNVK